jgi:hypothetical protein
MRMLANLECLIDVHCNIFVWLQLLYTVTRRLWQIIRLYATFWSLWWEFYSSLSWNDMRIHVHREGFHCSIRYLLLLFQAILVILLLSTSHHIHGEFLYHVLKDTDSHIRIIRLWWEGITTYRFAFTLLREWERLLLIIKNLVFT